MKKGRCGTMTHDYKLNGTATPFAALYALEGQIISMCDDRQRHQEWLKFPRAVDDVVPPDKHIHMIVNEVLGLPARDASPICMDFARARWYQLRYSGSKLIKESLP